MPDRLHSNRGSNQKLVHQLTEQLHDLTGPGCEIHLKRERPWASITFSGTRHLFQIECAGGDAKRVRQKLEGSLPEHGFDLAGHFVADALVKAGSDQVEPVHVEILTINDPVI